MTRVAAASSLRSVVGVATIVLAGTTMSARRTPPPAWELRFTEWINRMPDAGTQALYPVMQCGAGAAPVVAAGAVLTIRRRPE